MTTALQTFKTPSGSKLRTLERDGGYFFVGKDAAKALGYAKSRNAILAHVDAEDRQDALIQGSLKGGTQVMTIISESGLYSLILSSKLPEAKAFKRWVTSEVLPSLRRTGSYSAPAAAPAAEQGTRYYWAQHGAYFYAYRVEAHRIIWHAKFLTQDAAAEFCEVMNSRTPNTQALSPQLSNRSK